MKKIIISAIFVLEIMVCFVIAQLVNVGGSDISDIAIYPFVALAESLHNLSSSGHNLMAWIILIEIVLLPVDILMVLIVNDKYKLIHSMLPVVSAYMFFMMYIFINPSFMIEVFGKSGYRTIVDLEVAICSLFYILVIMYIVAVLLITIRKTSEKNIIIYIQGVILLIGLVLVFDSVCIQPILAKAEYKILSNELLEYKVDMKYTNIFYIIKMIIEFIPCLLYIVMAVNGISILDCMKKDRFSDSVLEQTKILSKMSVTSIIILIVINIVYNIFAITNLSKLYGDYKCFVFPVYFVIFSLFIILFSKYIEDTKKIKEDNDLFV